MSRYRRFVLRVSETIPADSLWAGSSGKFIKFDEWGRPISCDGPFEAATFPYSRGGLLEALKYKSNCPFDIMFVEANCRLHVDSSFDIFESGYKVEEK
jgi:hypothetical protein